MASYHIALSSKPTHLNLSPVEDKLAVLFSDGTAQIWTLHTRLPRPEAGSRLRGGGKVAEPRICWEGCLAPRGTVIPKQVAIGRDGEIAALFWVETPDNVACALVTISLEGRREEIVLDRAVDLLSWSQQGWLVMGSDGVLRKSDKRLPMEMLILVSLRWYGNEQNSLSSPSEPRTRRQFISCFSDFV